MAYKLGSKGGSDCGQRLYLFMGKSQPWVVLKIQAELACSPPGGPSHSGCVAASLCRRAVQGATECREEVGGRSAFGLMGCALPGWRGPAGRVRAAGCCLSEELPLALGGWFLGADRGDPDLFSAPRTQPALTQKLENGNDVKMTGFEGLRLLREGTLRGK